jgi:N utilization substance protein A
MNVLLDEDPETGKTATVIVPDRQLSLAIGKEGQNARLSAKLTGWRIDIKSATEAAEETMGRLEDITLASDEMDLLTYAEVLLHQRDMGDLTDEERKLIEQEVRVGGEEGLPWPEKEPVEDVEATVAEGAVQATMAEPAISEEAAGAPSAEVEEAVLEAGPAAPEVAPEAPLAETELLDGSELEPSFVTEPIEGSSGWVLTEPEEDYYSGWEDTDEQTPDLNVEWVPEPFEEIEESARPGKTSKKKKSGKSRYQRFKPGDR